MNVIHFEIIKNDYLYFLYEVSFVVFVCLLVCLFVFCFFFGGGSFGVFVWCCICFFFNNSQNIVCK